MKTISRIQLVNLLINQRAAMPVSLVTVTDARLLKTGNPYPNVRKVSRINGLIQCDYEVAVSNQRKREGNDNLFYAAKRATGERVFVLGAPTPLVKYKNGNTAVTIKIEKAKKPLFLLESGKFIGKSAIQDFIPERKNAEASQGVEESVIVRDYGINSIRAIKYNGEKYQIAGN